MATPKLDFINLAYGGATALKEQNSAFPQDFTITGRPEYGTALPWLKAADHFRGVMYGNKRSLDFSTAEGANSHRLGDQLKTGTVIGLLAIPQYSHLYGLEVRVDKAMLDVNGDLVAGAAAEFKLATTGEVIATVPLDATGATYTPLDGVLAELYTAYGNDAIEMTLVSIPEATGTDDEFVCVPLPCDEGFDLCISVAVNFINNAIEPRCEKPCDEAFA